MHFSVALALGLALVSGCGRSPDRVMLGVAIARNHQHGAILATEEINRCGGIGGRPLELYGLEYVRDPELDARLTLEWAQDFAAQPDLLAVVGHSDSASTLVTGGLYNQLGLLQIATVASNPSITDLGPWTYRMCITDTVQGAQLARYAYRDWNKQRALVVFVNDDYGRALADRFRSEFTRQGGEIVHSVPTTEVMDTQDEALVRSVLERCTGDGFGAQRDVLVLFVREKPGRAILDTMAGVGLDCDVLGGDALAYPLFRHEAHAAEVPVHLTLFFDPDRVGERGRHFVAAFTERFGTEPVYGAAFAYDAVHLLAGAVVDGGFTRDGTRRALEAGVAEGRVYHGATGAYRFNAERDAERSFFIGRISDRGFETIVEIPGVSNRSPG